MRRSNLRDALYSYLEDNWTKTDIAWPEMSYSPNGTDAYVKPTLVMGDTFEGEIGYNTDAVDIETGIFFVNLFSPITDTFMEAELMAESIRDLFRRTKVNNVATGAVSLTGGHLDLGDERYYQFTIKVEIPFNTRCA